MCRISTRSPTGAAAGMFDAGHGLGGLRVGDLRRWVLVLCPVWRGCCASRDSSVKPGWLEVPLSSLRMRRGLRWSHRLQPVSSTHGV